MLKLKNAALVTAVMLALAACGGGSDPAPTSPGTETPGGQNPGGENPGGENPGGENPGGENPPANDATFQGTMNLAANQVLFNGNGIDYGTFSTTGAYGQARGTNAPLQSFGLRVYQADMMGQSDTVRVGFELDDVNSDARIQMLIDQATLAVDAEGNMSITVPDAATGYVVVRDATGQTATVQVADLPADVLRLVPIPDDSTSEGLTLDVDALMGAAINAASAEQQTLLQSMQAVEGEFTLRMGITGVELLSGTGADLSLTSPLVVADQPAIAGGYDADPTDEVAPNGSGVEGTFYIGIVPEGV